MSGFRILMHRDSGTVRWDNRDYVLTFTGSDMSLENIHSGGNNHVMPKLLYKKT